MIQVTDLTFHYPHSETRVAVLNKTNLTITEGESVAIIGPNGCGKTTLARCLNGLLLPTQGDVYVDRLNTKSESDLTDIRRLVGIVFQNPENQIVSTTVEREIAFGLENLGVPREQMHEIVTGMLARFDLEKYRDRAPHLLSGGEMQRLALAAVVAMSPKYLILDEPTSLLDPASRKTTLSLISGLSSPQANVRITPILITQYPEEALICSRLLVLQHGRVVLDGQPAEIFHRVDDLRRIGLEAPVEFEVKSYLQEISSGRFSLNTSDFLPIP